MPSGLGLRQSMSRKGNCHDNAIMENFFERLEVKMFYGEEKTFRYYEDFRKALEEYMLWYNQERVKEYLQWKSPILRRFKHYFFIKIIYLAIYDWEDMNSIDKIDLDFDIISISVCINIGICSTN